MELKTGTIVRLKTREAFENTFNVTKTNNIEYPYKIKDWNKTFPDCLCNIFGEIHVIKYYYGGWNYPIEIIEEIME